MTYRLSPRQWVSQLGQHFLASYWRWHERAQAWHADQVHQQRQARYPTTWFGVNVVLEQATLEGDNGLGAESVLLGQVTLGRGTTVGRGALLHGGVITVGRYTQLGPAVAFYAINHPMQHLTSYVGAGLFQGALRQAAQRGQIQVGHDVWLGHGAVVLNNVTIQDGAIIGAGAIVTRDIPAYAIAVGNPARVIKYRFDPATIELLQQLQWWQWPVAQLRQFEGLFHLDYPANPQRFRAALQAALQQLPAEP